MERTSNLDLPYIIAAQAQKHVTHNEAIRALDAIIQLSVAKRTSVAPPSQTPDDGYREIVAAPATDIWTGKEGQVAAWQDGAWAYYPPQPGWLAWVEDESILMVYDDAQWLTTGQSGANSVNPAAMVGINATADATNRLSISAPSSLFSHEGSDHRIVVNKQAAANTASVIFQSDYSGRAEYGLTGDDDFRVKVSADGAAWNDALIIDRATGAVSMPATSSSAASAPRSLFLEQKPAGTNGGVLTASTWNTREVNAVQLDQIGIGLNNGQFSLPTGSYYVRAAAMAFACNANMLRLRDVDNNVTLVTGLSCTVWTGDSTAAPATLEGYFTLANAATLTLQHICHTTTPAFGRGAHTGAAQTSEPETYGSVFFERLS